MRMLRTVLLASLLSSCSVLFSETGAAPDAQAVDAQDNDSDGADENCWSRSTLLFGEACDFLEAGAPLSLTQSGVYSYDTSSGTLRDPGGAQVEHVAALADGPSGQWRVISAEAFELGADSTFVAVGTRRLAVVARTSIDINGGIDVGSTIGRNGPATQLVICSGQSGTAGESKSSGGGGGGGGGGSGQGGRGGNGDGSSGGVGGNGSSLLLPLPGCTGGNGGESILMPDSNVGGIGGGVLALVTEGAISIMGTINAGGAGGRRPTFDGASQGGGGGGGSGGTVLLDAAEISLGSAAIVAANGGGGGGVNGDGQRGRVSGNAAVGGGGLIGGAGGSGSAGVTLEGGLGGDSSSNGGGGGGGGAGFLFIHGPAQVSGNFSPPAIMID